MLSHGALRGTIVAVHGPRTFRVASDWDVPGDCVRGFRFAMLGREHAPVRVESHEPREGTLRLDAPPGLEVKPGARFELLSPEEAPLLGLRLATATPLDQPLPPVRMRLATTRGTNALLERRGAPVAFFVTAGFGDLLRIGTQQRPDLFALDIQKPEPLYREVIEVPERLAANGQVVRRLDVEALAPVVQQLRAAGIRAAAVALLHSWSNPVHEQELEKFLRRHGFEPVSCSAALAPCIKILPRAETAVVDAYLAAIVVGYLERVGAALTQGSLHVMTSAGGLQSAGSYQAKDCLLSGPAAGVVGAARAGRRSGFARLISFDMGGTSTDVARVDTAPHYVFEQRIGSAHLVAPALAIETVAAGGGSICSFEHGELRVGPESAGAVPGPACYGAGGPLTLTDVNLLLGRLDPERFAIPLELEAAREACARLCREVAASTGQTVVPEEILAGLANLADERMADAVRRISVRQGYDPRDYTLVAFGGAGGQHACAVASHLGLDTVLIPAQPALASAVGLGAAAMERFAARQVLLPLDVVQDDLPAWAAELAAQAATALRAEGAEPCSRRVLSTLRLDGQESSLQVEGEAGLDAAFEAAYRATFGYWPAGRGIEVESLRVIVAAPAGERSDGVADVAANAAAPVTPPRAVSPLGQARVWFAGAWHAVPRHERGSLPAGAAFAGPALVTEPYSVVVVAPGWACNVDAAGALVLRRQSTAAPPAVAPAAPPEIVRLELFAHRFETIAREMGEMLGRTAVSTNVKERLDFSCAVLDASGELIVNAPHIPVHLGALGMCVRSVREVLPMQPGDVIVTNHPAYGGTHLPDVSVISPVHLPDGGLLGYVASRAHHAEIGGIQPGSMPPNAAHLVEEGVVIAPMHLYRRGEARWEAMRRLLATAPFPSRAVEENLAHLRAAVAANRLGVRALLALAFAHGASEVRAAMAGLSARAAARLGAALQRVPAGIYTATEALDDGTPLQVRSDVRDGTARGDFAGSGGVHPGSLNASPAVVGSAVLYVLRLLVQEPMPLNEGSLRAVRVHVPPGLLAPDFPADPARSPAVCGGNVETSQRLVDVLLKALGLAACSQGTMNNVVFGTESMSYYETVGGGAGAGPGFDGASAVHTHMTNTRCTDPEVLELRYPVRLERFAIRTGTGGSGRHRGGDGIVRQITFLAPMTLSVLGQHRHAGPYGLEGGGRGQPARQVVVRANGTVVPLDSIAGCEVGAGDRFELETPGGGGYGAVAGTP